MTGDESSPPEAGGLEPVIGVLLALLVTTAVLLGAVVLLGSVAGLAAADDHNATATPTAAPNGTATATPTPTPTPTPEPTPDQSRSSSSSSSGSYEPPTRAELSIDELRQGGTQIPNAAPSTRWLDGGGAVYVDYQDPNPLVLETGDSWEAGKILSPGQLVETRNLRMHAQRPRDAEARSYNLTIVYWQTRERTITGPDGERRTETELANVTVDTAEIDFRQSFGQSDVRLRKSDSERYVTMWLVDESGDRVSGAQWTFRHRTAATSEAAGISTMGDLYGWVAKWIAIPLIIGIMAVAYVAMLAIRRAKSGPGMGLIFWGVSLGAFSVTAVGVGWFYLADWFVAVPLAIPASLSFITLIVILETYERDVETIEFVKPVLELTESPTGGVSLDAISLETAEEKVAKVGSTPSVIRDGVRPFLARCFSHAAELEGASALKTEIDVVDGDHDGKIWVHPRSAEPLEYEPEGWQLDTPKPADKGAWFILGLVVTLVGAALAATWLWVSPILSLLAGGLLLGVATLRPEAGRAVVDPAGVHGRQAFISMVYLAREIDNADTISEAREKIIKKEARSEKDVEEALTERDATLIQEMFSTDVSEAVAEFDDDGELEELIESATSSNGTEVPSDDD